MDIDTKRIEELEERVEKIERFIGNEGTIIPRVKKTSAKEFLLRKRTSSEAQKVLVLGFYLEHKEGVESFNVLDLEAVFRSAKEKVPKNLNDAANKNVARGLLMEAAEKKNSKKAWYLTSTGERYVEDKLNLAT